MLSKRKVFGLATACIGLLYLAGCGKDANDQSSPTPPDLGVGANKKPDDKDKEHGHKPGAHGGIIASIGRDNYHAEAVFKKGGLLKLIMLGKDETRLQEVESQELTAYVKADGDTESAEIVLRPSPQRGDTTGKTTLFIGQLPDELQGKKVEVTVPSITIAGERFRFSFTNVSESHDAGMPAGLGDAEARKLYLTPGGIYTAADIKANGNMTAAQKYKTFRAKHDMKPKSGDKICPVTFTKANPSCTWIVAGKAYEFCCPPCIDEFVGWAKEDPGQIKEPKEYLKK